MALLQAAELIRKAHEFPGTLVPSLRPGAEVVALQDALNRMQRERDNLLVPPQRIDAYVDLDGCEYQVVLDDEGQVDQIFVRGMHLCQTAFEAIVGEVQRKVVAMTRRVA